MGHDREQKSAQNTASNSPDSSSATGHGILAHLTALYGPARARRILERRLAQRRAQAQGQHTSHYHVKGTTVSEGEGFAVRDLPAEPGQNATSTPGHAFSDEQVVGGATDFAEKAQDFDVANPALTNGEEVTALEETTAVVRGMLSAAGYSGDSYAILAGEVASMLIARNYSGVRRLLVAEITDPAVILGLLQTLAKRYGQDVLVSTLNTVIPWVAAYEIAKSYYELAKSIIHREHRKGQRDAVAHRYAWGFANAFLRDDFQPQWLAEIGQDYIDMNRGLREGITAGQVGRGCLSKADYQATRAALIAEHNGDAAAAAQALCMRILEKLHVE